MPEKRQVTEKSPLYTHSTKWTMVLFYTHSQATSIYDTIHNIRVSVFDD